jgi:hypothetical protein
MEPPKLVLEEQPHEAASLGIEPPHIGTKTSHLVQSRLTWYRAASLGTEPRLIWYRAALFVSEQPQLVQSAALISTEV